MIELIFNNLWDSAVSMVGSPFLVAFIIMLLFCGLAMLLGLPFDFALLLTAPIPYALQKAGYLEIWVSGLIIVIVLGFSIYLIWIRFQNKG